MMTTDEIRSSVQAMADRDAARIDFEYAWFDIYMMMEDQAFDYRGKPFAPSPDTLLMWDGTKFVEFVEVPW